MAPWARWFSPIRRWWTTERPSARIGNGRGRCCSASSGVVSFLTPCPQNSTSPWPTPRRRSGRSWRPPGRPFGRTAARRRCTRDEATDGQTRARMGAAGSGAGEAAVCSAIPRDRGMLVVDNGVYGRRMLQMAEAHGIPADVLCYDSMTPARPAEVEARLAGRPDLSHVAIVHHETTTGLLNPVPAVAEVAARLGRGLIVDATSSLFGEPLHITQDGIDFVTASATKCVQGMPGVGFVLARRRALEALQGRPPRSVYLDLYAHYASQEQDNTPFTPAIQIFFALRQALEELEQEGV